MRDLGFPGLGKLFMQVLSFYVVIPHQDVYKTHFTFQFKGQKPSIPTLEGIAFTS